MTQRPPWSRSSHTFIIGDIHGCLDEFKELLDVLGPTSDDHIVLTGDLVDRGPDSVGVVRLAQQIGALSVMGNHDEKHVRWARYVERQRRTGEKIPMRVPSADRQEITARLVEEGLMPWLAALPRYIRVLPDVVVVHAGLRPNKTVEEQAADKDLSMLHLRYIDNATGKPAGLVDMQQPPDSTYWTRLWHGPESVIYGHNADDREVPRIERPIPGVTCIGIDQGCVFGGCLTALAMSASDFTDRGFIQVMARREYHPYIPPSE